MDFNYKNMTHMPFKLIYSNVDPLDFDADPDFQRRISDPDADPDNNFVYITIAFFSPTFFIVGIEPHTYFQ